MFITLAVTKEQKIDNTFIEKTKKKTLKKTIKYKLVA